jgi:uncharacterized RDD family membrane protein YckC
MSTPPPPPPPPSARPPQPGGFNAPHSAVPGGRPLATPGMRILARVLDAIIVGVAGSLIGAAIILSDGDSAGFGGLGGDLSAGERLAFGLVSLVIGFFYEAVLTKLKGGTPMKLAFGMSVVRADGMPVGWPESIIRWGFLGLVGLIPFVGGIAALIIWIVSIVFLFTDSLRQTVSDKVAKTIVVTSR